MKTAVVIPARLESTRLPGKVLIDIAGKPLLLHVYEKAFDACIGDVYVATDSLKIKEVMESFGAKVVLTGKASSGSHRVYLASSLIDADVFLNVQGDEPLINPEALRKLAEIFAKSSCPVATLACWKSDEEEFKSRDVVKVVVDKERFALYFSRSPIPFGAERFLKHIGVYIYTKDALDSIYNLPPSPLELAENLEQLRFLYYGFRVKVVETEHDTIGVDTPHDLEKVRKILEGH